MVGNNADGNQCLWLETRWAETSVRDKKQGGRKLMLVVRNTGDAKKCLWLETRGTETRVND